MTSDTPEIDILGVKQDSLVLLIRQTNHALNNMSMRVDGISKTLMEVQLATTRLEQANTAAEITELKSDMKAACVRIDLLEDERTKKAGLVEFARFLTTLLPWFVILASAFAWYVSSVR